MQLHLGRWGTAGQAAASTLTLLGLLIAGAFGSIFVTQIVPISIRRRELLEQLGHLRRRHRGLGRKGQSLLRASIRLELRRLRELLYSRKWYSVDVQTVFADAHRQTGVLARQVELLRQVDDLQQALEPCERASVAKIRQVERQIAAAVRILESADLNDVQLGAAQRELDHARALKAGCTDYTERERQALLDDRAALAAELAPLQDRFKPEFAAVPHLHPLLAPTIATPADRGLPRFETQVERLRLFAEYLRARIARSGAGTATGNAATATADDARAWEKLAELLARDGPEALRAAGLLVCQVREGVYTERLLRVARGTKPRAARIVVTPRVPVMYEAVNFSVVFDDRTYNTCAAREALICTWTFVDLPPTSRPRGSRSWPWQREEDAAAERSDSTGSSHATGWSVPHYFDVSGPHRVSVRFSDPLRDVPDAPPAPAGAEAATATAEPPPTATPPQPPQDLTETVVVVRPFTGGGTFRSFLEGGRLALLVLIALAALLAGARDQVLKLDPLAAAIAILAIGFGANGVKNLFAPPPVPASPTGNSIAPPPPPTTLPPVTPPPPKPGGTGGTGTETGRGPEAPQPGAPGAGPPEEIDLGPRGDAASADPTPKPNAAEDQSEPASGGAAPQPTGTDVTVVVHTPGTNASSAPLSPVPEGTDFTPKDNTPIDPPAQPDSQQVENPTEPPAQAGA